MFRRHKPDDEKHAKHKPFYFRGITYLLTSRGIYEPKPSETEQKRRNIQRGREERAPFWVNVITAWRPVLLTSLLSLATIYLLYRTVHYARLQWGEMEKAARAADRSATEAKNAVDVTRDALEKVQRAFIAPGGPAETVLTSVPTGQAMWFKFRWDNSGTTPTRGFRTHISYEWGNGVMPKDFAFPDLWEPGKPHVNVHANVGPKASVGVDVGPIPTSVTDAVAKGDKHLYFWGWAKYRDVFDKTPDHVTLFCFDLIPIKIKSTGGGESTTWSFDNCPRHNCADEECGAQR